MAASAYRKWQDDGFKATARAAGLVTSIRAIVVMLAVLALISILVVASSGEGGDGDFTAAYAGSVVAGTVVTGVLLLAAASALELLRVQTEHSLFNDDDDDDVPPPPRGDGTTFAEAWSAQPETD